MKRWPIIRHIRWFLEMLSYRAWWNEVGREHWLAPSPRDVEYLKDIWEGRQ